MLKKIFFVLVVSLSILFTNCSKVEKQALNDTVNYVQDNYTKKEVTITMRDGIKLFTSIYSPKDTTKTYPILLQRTPYSCQPYGLDQYKEKIGPNEHLMKDGYIVVYQDVRGLSLIHI